MGLKRRTMALLMALTMTVTSIQPTALTAYAGEYEYEVLEEDVEDSVDEEQSNESIYPEDAEGSGDGYTDDLEDAEGSGDEYGLVSRFSTK